MKINLSASLKDRKIGDSFSKEIDFFSKSEIVFIEIYGTPENPKLNFISSGKSESNASWKPLALLTLSWSQSKKFQLKYYSHTELVGSMGGMTIQNFNVINGESTLRFGSLSILFIAEASHQDLDKEKISCKDFVKLCVEQRIRISDLTISGAGCDDKQLSGVDFSGAKFRNVYFKKISLRGSQFSKCLFNEVTFEDVDLSEANFNGCRSVYDRRKIETGQGLVFRNIKNFNDAKIEDSFLFAIFENVILFKVSFSKSKLIATKFRNCSLTKVDFSGSRLLPYKVNNTKPGQKRKPNDIEVIAVTSINSLLYDSLKDLSIGQEDHISEQFENQRDDIAERIIEGCVFKGSYCELLDLSNNHILDIDFGDSLLIQPRIFDSKCERVSFSNFSSAPVNFRESDFSKSEFIKCNFSRADMSKLKMLSAVLEDTDLVDVILHGSKLMRSSFKKSDLTGSDLSASNLTKVVFDECILSSSNFFRTQRGGLDLKITSTVIESGESTDNEAKKIYVHKSNCTIGCVDWGQGDGEAQIDEDTFLEIVLGKQAPAAVLSKSNATSAIYMKSYNQVTTTSQAISKSANELNDSSLSTTGDIDESGVQTGGISTSEINSDNDNSSLEIEDPVADKTEVSEENEDGDDES